MREHFTSEFEDKLRNLVAVPSASPEVVNSLWERIGERSTKKLQFAQKNHPDRSLWAGLGKSVLFPTPSRAFLLIPLILLIVLGIFFVTPAGRVVADQIMAFFTHTTNNEKPIPYLNTTITPTTSTPTVTVESSYPTSTLPEEMNSKQGNPDEKRPQSDASFQIEYPLKEPHSLPPGYKFSYARYFPETKNTLFVYAFTEQAKGEMILLTLSPTLIQEEVGPNTKVEKIQVKGFEGNMIQGGWLALAGESHETWEARVPVTTLRWFDGEVYIKLQFHLNEPTSPAYLSLSQMLKVAESIQKNDPSNPRIIAPALMNNYREMEAQVGFTLLEPGILPAGYELLGMEQVPGRQQVDARYRPATSGETGPRLTITQIPLSGLPPIKPYINDQVELVNINGRQGRLTAGANDGGSSPSWWLHWETPDLAMSIWFYPGPTVGEQEGKASMVEIAKSMK